MNKLISALVLSASFISSAAFATESAINPVNIAPSANAVKPLVNTPAEPVKQEVVKQDTININTADAQALTKLKGVGPKKAEAIVAWRKANGAFKSIEQLVEVKGIGEKTLDDNRKIIRI